jgi:hypothetical protein
LIDLAFGQLAILLLLVSEMCSLVLVYREYGHTEL